MGSNFASLIEDKRLATIVQFFPENNANRGTIAIITVIYSLSLCLFAIQNIYIDASRNKIERNQRPGRGHRFHLNVRNIYETPEAHTSILIMNTNCMDKKISKPNNNREQDHAKVIKPNVSIKRIRKEKKILHTSTKKRDHLPYECTDFAIYHTFVVYTK